jgi:hypothetical protein
MRRVIFLLLLCLICFFVSCDEDDTMCYVCFGSGNCYNCNGKGYNGVDSNECSVCDGTGKCVNCQGSGSIRKK